MDNDETFTPRGNITITNVQTGALTINQDSLDDQQKVQLKYLAQKGKFYRVKATVLAADGRSYTYLTSSKACSLIRAYLADQLFVSLDHTGFVLSITQMVATPGSEADCTTVSKSELDSIEEFNTEVYVKGAELGPVPDTASFLNKIEQERMARERGETKDNRGFFAKYWMYIVPVAILVLVSGVTNPEAGAGR